MTEPAAPKRSPNEVVTSSGLRYTDLKVGEGDEAKSGHAVEVHYTGWLTDGTKFDSSLDRKQPFKFQLGAGQVIQGWDQGVAGMKVGGKRKLTIPPDLGYGAARRRRRHPAQRHAGLRGRAAGGSSPLAALRNSHPRGSVILAEPHSFNGGPRSLPTVWGCTGFDGEQSGSSVACRVSAR